MSLEIALTQDRGPRAANQGASKLSGDDITSVTRLELVVNLNHEQDELSTQFDVHSADRRTLYVFEDLPAGSLLRVVVGRRTFVTDDALSAIRALKRGGVHVLVMAETIESGLAWTSAIDGRAAA